MISGFLITKILADEIDGGNGSLISFYERRIRRIVPALFAMLLAVSMVSYTILIPTNYILEAKTAAAAALSTSNIYLYRHTGYFDFGTDLIPLLHTWSLGVEEQFYILFPPLFLAARRVLHLSWTWIIIPLLFASLAFSIVSTEFQLRALLHGFFRANEYAIGSFYLPFSRSWEFLVGAAVGVNAIPHAPKSSLIRNFLAILGLGFVLASVLVFNPAVKFPGFAALLPCLGAALIIYANTHQITFVGRLLSIYPLVRIGLISYSLYLWHWPMISFMRLIWGGEEPLLVHWLLFASMFPVAWLSWRYIERPFRRNVTVFTRRRLFIAAGIGACAFLGNGIFVAANAGLPSRFSPAALAVANGANDISWACDSKSTADITAGRVCTFGAARAPISFALFGDSFAVALGPAVEAAAHQAGVRGYVLTHATCYPLVGIKSKADCKDFVDAAIELIHATPSIKMVILISRWTTAEEGTRFGARMYNDLFITDEQSKTRSYSENRAVFDRSLEHTAHALLKYRVFVVAFVPEQPMEIPQADAVRIQFGFSEIAVPRAIVERRQANVRQALAAASRRYGFSVLDSMLALCDRQTCRAVQDGKSLYADEDHLSRFGALKETNLLAVAFKYSQENKDRN